MNVRTPLRVLPGGQARWWRKPLRAVVFCALLALLLSLVSAVLMPEHRGGGAAWAAFLSQPRDSIDVIFFGSSHVFDGVDPSIVWRQQGIASFSHAGPAQQLRMTKYYVLEALRTQRPKVVAVELAAMTNPPSQHNEKMHQLNLNYMPMGVNKLKAVLFETPPDERVQCLFPIWTYHSRWPELEQRDYDIFGKNLQNGYLRGYQPVIDSHEVSSTPRVIAEDARREAIKNMEVNIQALYEIAEACERRDADLLLFMTPVAPPSVQSLELEWAFERVRERYPRTRMLDLSTPGAVPAIRYESDFLNGGHLSYRGAEKTSALLADYLAGTYDLQDRRSDPDYSAYHSDAAERDAHIARALARKK